MAAHLPGAQTERRGGAGPAGACLAVRTPPAAFLAAYGFGSIMISRSTVLPRVSSRSPLPPLIVCPSHVPLTDVVSRLNAPAKRTVTGPKVSSRSTRSTIVWKLFRCQVRSNVIGVQGATGGSPVTKLTTTKVTGYVVGVVTARCAELQFALAVNALFGIVPAPLQKKSMSGLSGFRTAKEKSSAVVSEIWSLDTVRNPLKPSSERITSAKRPLVRILVTVAPFDDFDFSTSAHDAEAVSTTAAVSIVKTLIRSLDGFFLSCGVFGSCFSSWRGSMWKPPYRSAIE